MKTRMQRKFNDSTLLKKAARCDVKIRLINPELLNLNRNSG